MRAVLAFDEQALDDFAGQLQLVPRILAALNARLSCPLGSQELPDLAQSCVVVIWKKLPQFEGRSSLATWMYRICSLELMNATRRARRAPEVHQLAVGSEIMRDALVYRDDEPVRTLVLRELQQGLESLEEKLRQVVRLKHYDDLPYAEIGRRLRIPTSTAKARYHRALQHLQSRLGRGWAEGQK